MAVEKIDMQIQSMLSDAQMRNQKDVGKDDSADAARRAAEKKIAERKASVQSSVVQKESFTKGPRLQQKIQDILGGSAGQEAGDALQNWGDNSKLQGKLSDAQKRLFQEAMVKDPQKGAKSAQAMNRISAQPAFEQSVKDSQQLGTLQQSIVENPSLEKPASELLSKRFMTSPKTDAETKQRFMRFGLDQAKKGGTDFKLGSVKHASDMLNSLSQASMPKGAQKAAMNMVERQPSDTQAMNQVDSFASKPDIQKMPSFAKGRATELLAKSGGDAQVKQGFETLAADPKFQAQSTQNKGRFFATIGSGNANEFRALTDQSLMALQSNSFPKRAGKVASLLTKMASQAKTSGAKSVDANSLLKGKTRTSTLPVPPKLTSTEGLDEDEAQKVRSQNRGRIIQFYTQVQRSYEQAEKKLKTARFIEDVNKLQNLKEAPPLEASVLSPDEQKFVMERRESVKQKLDQVKKFQRQRARELRGKRMPPARRRAKTAAARTRGRQPKYFSPASNRATSATQAFLQATGSDARLGLASTPQQSLRQAAQSQKPQGTGGDIQSQVASALAQMGNGPMTADKAGQVAQTIANQVAAQVASQVTQQLLGGQAKGAQSPAPGQKPAAQGQVDGWGIPRTFERDLGAASTRPVKERAIETAPQDAPGMDEVLSERYTGRTLVKDPSQIRMLVAIFESNWKELSRSESALLRNLGWTQQLWDTREAAGAKWPVAMATQFVNLNPTQREAVRNLGLSAHDWDTKIQGFTMGKNA